MLCCVFSDGVVRVFTTASERAAPDDVQQTFEEEVAASSIPAQIGDVKTDELCGPEKLLNAGNNTAHKYCLLFDWKRLL